MKSIAFVLTCLFALSCAGREKCGPSNCGGCCSPVNDVCVENDPHVCSPPGATCAECDQFSVCTAGQCVRPPFFIGPASVAFGQTTTGHKVSATLMFTNGGDLPLKIRDAGFEPPTEFTGFSVDSNAALTVMPNQQSSMMISFTPPTTGFFGGTLIFDSNAGDPQYMPGVSGSGI